MIAARFENVSCSNCGRDFGPGDHGFSHCDQHPGHKRETLRDAAHDLKAALQELLEVSESDAADYDAPHEYEAVLADAQRRAHAAISKAMGDL